MTKKTENNKNRKDSFWAIRSINKAIIVRTLELILLSIFVFFIQSKENLLSVLATGILVVTTFSFIVYKCYEKLTEKIKPRKEKTHQFFKDMNEYIVREWLTYFKEEWLAYYVHKLNKFLRTKNY